MPIKVRCPGCGSVHEVGPEMAGTRAQCRCGKVIVIPPLKQPASPAPKQHVLDDDMLGPVQESEPEPVPDEEMRDVPRAPRTSWRYETDKAPLTGKRISKAVLGILLGLGSLAGAIFFAASHGLAIQACLEALKDQVYTSQFGSLRANVELVVNAVLLLPASVMILAGLGIVVSSILALTKPEWEFEWADIFGALAGSAYASLMFLALLMRLIADLVMPVGMEEEESAKESAKEAAQKAAVESQQFLGDVTDAAFVFMLAVIAPVLLIACYWFRRKD